MRAQSDKEQVQGVRRGEHLPAQSAKEPMQGVRRVEHLPAQSAKERVQGVWRGASTGPAAPSEIIDLRDSEAEGEGRADARGCRSGKGKEIAGEEAATEDGGDGRATSAGPGDVGGGGKGKERADNGSIQAQ